MGKRSRRAAASWAAAARQSGGTPAPRPLWRLLNAQDLREHPLQVASIVLVLIGTLLVPPVGVVVSTVRRVRATEQVSGRIVHEAVHGGRRTKWVYTYDYGFEGAPYRGSLAVHREGPHFDVGEPIDLFVDPAAPHRSYVSGALVRPLIGTWLFFWGGAAVLVSLRGVPSGRFLLRPRYAWTFALVFTGVLLFVLPLAIPLERWWIVPLEYLGVLAVASLWLLVRWRRGSRPT